MRVKEKIQNERGIVARILEGDGNTEGILELGLIGEAAAAFLNLHGGSIETSNENTSITISP